MILICDSGSTKADWVLLSGKTVVSEFQTEGLNPVHLSEEIISERLSSEKNINSRRKDVTEIYFFGAGCGNAEGKNRMASALKKKFPDSVITVENDLMAAAMATCGNLKGIVAILGTGSNCCYFDGTDVHVKNFGLGYLLGDEGSGTWFGKQLLKQFLYGRLPVKIEEAFHSEFLLNREQIIDTVYRKPYPNIFLSSFMPFLMKFRNDDHIRKLFKAGVNEFFETNIAGFSESKNVDLHFVGSIASLLENEIRETGKEKKYSIGRIMKRPMEGLIRYYSQILDN